VENNELNNKTRMKKNLEMRKKTLEMMKRKKKKKTMMIEGE
jgi:hypothetical protein